MVNESTFQRKEIYDPTKGDFIREMRSSDIFNISTNGETSISATTTLASGTTDANTEIYLTHFVVSSSAAGALVYLTIGSSTVMPLLLPANTPVSIDAGITDAFGKVPPSTTVSIIAETSGTYTASLSGVRMPTYESVE